MMNPEQGGRREVRKSTASWACSPVVVACQGLRSAPGWAYLRLLTLGGGSGSCGRACTGFRSGQQRAAWFAEFGTDCSGPQSGRIEPDLDPAPLGVYHRPVVGQDPESVHHAGGAKMIEPPLHLHGADAVSVCISYSSGRGPRAGARGSWNMCGGCWASCLYLFMTKLSLT